MSARGVDLVGIPFDSYGCDGAVEKAASVTVRWVSPHRQSGTR